MDFKASIEHYLENRKTDAEEIEDLRAQGYVCASELHEGDRVTQKPGSDWIVTVEKIEYLEAKGGMLGHVSFVDNSYAWYWVVGRPEWPAWIIVKDSSEGQVNDKPKGDR